MRPATLDQRLEALRDIRRLGDGRVPESLLDRVGILLHRADGRRALSADHTVVGLFGATGSGKSSLLNAIVGEPVARSHVRRPTTSEPLAVVWETTGATPLLDWLEVRERHTGGDPIDPRAMALILLDLPDFDSVELSHREVAERLAGQVDVLVWVVDPQKYADAVLHADFLATYSRHGAVTLVVLNQVDLLSPADAKRVLDSLRDLVTADGLGVTRIIATSATSGEGIPELRAAIGALAAERATITARLEADVSAIAAEVAPPGRPAKVKPGQVTALTEQLAVAAGADVVASAVAASYRKRSGQATGWPVVSWILRFRPDPLARLGLRPRKGQDPTLHRTSLPAMNAGAQARVSLAVRGYADAAAEPFTESWRVGIRAEGAQALDRLPGSLDLAIARTALPTRGSWWWIPFGILQWLAIAAALAGVLWLLALAWTPTIGIRLPEVPKIEGWPTTTLLILGGVLLGILLAVAAAAISAAVGAHRRRRARRALLSQVAVVAREYVVDPIASELERAKLFGAALEMARNGEKEVA